MEKQLTIKSRNQLMTLITLLSNAERNIKTAIEKNEVFNLAEAMIMLDAIYDWKKQLDID